MQSKEKKQYVGQIFANSRKCEINFASFLSTFSFYFNGPRLKHIFESSLNLSLRMPRWFTSFQGLKLFLFFFVLLSLFAFLHAQLILTSVGQLQRELLFLGKTARLWRLYSPHFTPLRNYWNITTTQNVMRKANRPTWDCYFSSFVYISW